MEPQHNSHSLLSKDGQSAGSDHEGQDSFIQNRHEICRARAEAYYRPEKTKHITECPINETILVHEVTHYGEAAHTIRHWLRGGQVFVPRGDGNSLKWADCLDTLMAEVDGRQVPYELQGNLLKCNHTDVHHTQVPAELDAFADQLLAECRLPELIKKTQGYGEILEEVKGQLKGGPVTSLIVWHRNVKGGNRTVSRAEHEACESGALTALGQFEGKGALSKSAILHMGDVPDEALKGQKSLCGQHITTKDKKKRTMLQQLQFLCAAVHVSGAKLIVSERAGLADLVALAGGIPECQFISTGARLGNSRLTDVYESGCGMGHNVVFDASSKGNVALMKNACLKAMDEKAKLCAALNAYRETGVSGITRATTSATKSCVKK